MSTAVITRSAVDANGTEHTVEVEPVARAVAADGSVTLTISAGVTVGDAVEAAYRVGLDVGAAAGYEQGRQAMADAAAALVRQATAEIAAGGPIAAAVLLGTLPRTKVVGRDRDGRIVEVREVVG